MEYMISSPLKKLEVEPALENRKKYTRLKAKATALMLEAIPKPLADEMVSARSKCARNPSNSYVVPNDEKVSTRRIGRKESTTDKVGKCDEL